MPRPAADPPTLTPKSDTPQPVNTEAPPRAQDPPLSDSIFGGYRPPTAAEKEEERRRWCIERAIDWLHYTPAGAMDGRTIADLAGDILAFIVGTPPQPQPDAQPTVTAP